MKIVRYIILIFTLSLTLTLLADEQEITLTDTSWELVTIAETPILPDSIITIVFDDEERFSGLAGCNRYGGDYQTNDDAIAIGVIGVTRMMCADEDLMMQEANYLQMLENVTAYTVEDDMLTLTTEQGETLNFRRALELTDVQWQLIMFDENPVVPDSLVTLILGEEGVGGSGGCNAYGGDYETDGDAITFGDLFSTMMYCMDEGIMEQEISYLQSLSQATRYQIVGEILTITYGEESQTLTFEAILPQCSEDDEQDCPDDLLDTEDLS